MESIQNHIFDLHTALFYLTILLLYITQIFLIAPEYERIEERASAIHEASLACSTSATTRDNSAIMLAVLTENL
jgi:hypothetical protein